MTAIPWNEHLSLSSPQRRPSGHWTPLSRRHVETLGAVSELGPKIHGSELVKESTARARKAALKSWRAYVLPDPFLLLFAYNPLKQGSIYIRLLHLEEDGLVTVSPSSYPNQPGVPRNAFSITPFGRIVLAYERQRIIEESGRGTFFREALA